MVRPNTRIEPRTTTGSAGIEHPNTACPGVGPVTATDKSRTCPAKPPLVATASWCYFVPSGGIRHTLRAVLWWAILGLNQ
jgi:hypothetical protein